MEFHCVPDCSECCIKREYYPDKRFGKIGVLILPEEREVMIKHAKKLGLEICILPRVGVSVSGECVKPDKILAYQMMGIEDNGNTCPFLDDTGSNLSPHGGFACRIYDDRPLACAAYPLVSHNPVVLDQKCKFCKESCDGMPDENIDSETAALIKIERRFLSSEPFVWRYATAIGEKKDRRHFAKPGWIKGES